MHSCRRTDQHYDDRWLGTAEFTLASYALATVSTTSARHTS